MATFNGIITLAMPEASGTSQSGKQWRRRSYVLRYDNSNEQYPKEVLFDVLGDKIDSLNIQQGGEYELEIDFSVREYQGKRYMGANAWKATAKNVPTAPAPQSATPTLDSMGVSGYQKTSTPPPADDDLPF